jgi:hypothetical protein
MVEEKTKKERRRRNKWEYVWSKFFTTDPGVPGSIPGHYKKKVVGLKQGPLSLVSTTEELLDRKVAAPV